MSGDLADIHYDMASNSFFDDFKSLSESQSSTSYSDLIERLTILVEQATTKDRIENRPFALALIDYLHQLIPLIDQKLSDTTNEKDRRRTEVFLKALATYYRSLCLFDLFSSVKDLAKHRTIFQKYISQIKVTYFLNDCRYDNLAACILPIVAMTSIFLQLNESDIPSNLLPSLLAFTDRYLDGPERLNLIQAILAIIKVFSKKPALVPMIIRYEWPQACIRWLSDTKEPLKRDFAIDYYIHLILQKLARHCVGVQLLNEMNCITVLGTARERMRKTHTEAQFFNLQLLECMITALLMEADEIKQKTIPIDQGMLQIIDQLALTILESSRAESFSYNCFHISEPLMVLSKLSMNDNLLIDIMERNKYLFECLCQLIIHFTSMLVNNTLNTQPMNDETLLAVSNILWSISFHERYRDGFKTNSMLLHALSNLANSSSSTIVRNKSIPRDLCSVKKAAEGILWNLKSSSDQLPQPAIQPKAAQQPLAMISYSHSDSAFCRELVEQLSAHVPVWVDYKQASDAVSHSDDLWEEIARAMEMASVIVLIVSKEYYDSKSCRQELSYATDALKKRIVPIYAPNQQYRASGWLGIRIAGQKYIHFGRKVFAAAITELASMVINDQKPMATPIVVYEKPVSVTSCAATADEEEKPTENETLGLKNWTSKDIRQWFENNHIHPDLIKLYDDQFLTGTALLVYARHLNSFYRHEYARVCTKYYQTMNGQKLDTLHFVNFVDALFRLRAEHNPNLKLEDEMEKLADIHLPWTKKMLGERVTWF